MFSKLVVFTASVASILALEPQEINSYVSYSNNHNLVQPAATLVNIAATATPIYEAQATPSYTSPVVAKLALPAVAKYAAPSVPSYFTASASPVYSAPILVNHAAPSPTTYFNSQASASPVYAPAPFAKVAYAAPVAHYAAAPASHYATAPVAAPTYSAHQEEYSHPKYEYAYSVEDHHTGDIHSQQEQRDGDHVVGQYSLHEADGTVRIVKYYDYGHGFNAVVEKQGTPTESPAVLKKVIVPVAASHY